MPSLHVVFKKTEEYQLTRLSTIQVAYWYVAVEGEECALLGPVEKIPGNSRQPLTYEEAREMANKIRPSQQNVIIKSDLECFE